MRIKLPKLVQADICFEKASRKQKITVALPAQATLFQCMVTYPIAAKIRARLARERLSMRRVGVDRAPVYVGILTKNALNYLRSYAR